MPSPGARIDQAIELMENGVISTEQANELIGLTQQVQETIETYNEAYLVPRTINVPRVSSPGVVEYFDSNPPIAPIELRSPPDFDTPVVESTRLLAEDISYDGDSLHYAIQKMMARIEKLEKENLELKKLYEITIDKELERIANESDTNNV